MNAGIGAPTARSRTAPLAYSLREAWEAIGCSRSVFFALLRDGRIRAPRLSRRKRVVRAEELRRFLAEVEREQYGGDEQGAA